MSNLNTSYTIICQNGSCSCDIRTNIHGCKEEISAFKYSNWILIFYCALLSITAAASLWYLIEKRGQSFFLNSRRDRGKIRPRPQHIYFTMCLSYCPLRMVHSMLLICNIYPNVLWAEIGYILPIGLTAMVAILYPLSILYSTSAFEVGTNFASTRPTSTSSTISEIPITRHAIKMDLTCIFTIITTSCLFLSVAAMTGHYANTNNYKEARNLSMAQNIILVTWIILYILVMLWVWYRFMCIVWDNINDLNQHQIQNFELQNKLEQLRRGARNLSLPVYGQVITAIVYIPTIALYGLFRTNHTNFDYNDKINLTCMIILYFAFPMILHATQWIMIYNTITTPLPNSRNCTNRNSNNRYSNNRNSNKYSYNSGGTKPDEKAKNDEKRFSINSVNEVKRNSEIIRISFPGETGTCTCNTRKESRTDQPINNSGPKFTKTKLDEMIDEEKACDCTCNIRKIRYIDNDRSEFNNACTSTSTYNARKERYIDDGENGKIGGGILTNNLSNNSINPSDSGKNSSKISNKRQSLGSNTNVSNHINTAQVSTLPMTPSGIQNGVSSKRGSVISNKSSTSNTSTNSSSHRRREWLVKKPVSALNRSTIRDGYRSNV